MKHKLNSLLELVQRHENKISMLFGLVVVLSVTMMIINYLKNTPAELPSLAQNQTQVSLPSVKPTNQPEVASAADNQSETDTPQPTSSPQPSMQGEIASGVSDVNIAALLTPPAAQASEAEAKEIAQPANTYTVQPGDNLWKIAEQFYQTGYAWVEISQANQLNTPGIIEVGQTLVIPQLKAAYPSTLADAGSAVGGPYPEAETQPPAEADTEQATPTPNSNLPVQVTLKPGDTLWNLAVKYYGNGFDWPVIAQANQITDHKHLPTGLTLTIPPLDRG